LINFVNDKYVENIVIKFNFVDNVLYLEIQEDPIISYLKNNISVYAPTNEVLWGKFYTTQILWENTGTALISYEDGHVAYQNRFKITSGDSISAMPVIKLWEKFVLGSGKQIKYENDDLYIKINSFINSPCPDGAQCFWSGKWINTEFIKNWQSQWGLDLFEAMWYSLELVDSDYTNYATFILSSSITTWTTSTWSVVSTWGVITWSVVTTWTIISTWSSISAWVDVWSSTSSAYTWTIGTWSDVASIAQDKDADVNSLFVRYIRKSIWKRTWDTAVMVSYNILWKQLTGNTTDYFIWAMCQEYKKSWTSLITWAVVNTPISVKVAFTGNVYYALSYQVPQVWTNYTWDVQNIFPKTVSDKILNMKQSDYDTMINDLLARTYIAGKKFFGL